MTETPKPSVPQPESSAPVASTPPQKSFSAKAQTTASNTYRLLKMIVFVVIAVLATLFVMRNWNDVEVDYVFGDVMMPLALVMLLGVAVGAVLALLGRWIWFRD